MAVLVPQAHLLVRHEVGVLDVAVVAGHVLVAEHVDAVPLHDEAGLVVMHLLAADEGDDAAVGVVRLNVGAATVRQFGQRPGPQAVPVLAQHLRRHVNLAHPHVLPHPVLGGGRVGVRHADVPHPGVVVTDRVPGGADGRGAWHGVVGRHLPLTDAAEGIVEQDVVHVAPGERRGGEPGPGVRQLHAHVPDGLAAVVYLLPGAFLEQVMRVRRNLVRLFEVPAAVLGRLQHRFQVGAVQADAVDDRLHRHPRDGVRGGGEAEDALLQVLTAAVARVEQGTEPLPQAHDGGILQAGEGATGEQLIDAGVLQPSAPQAVHCRARLRRGHRADHPDLREVVVVHEVAVLVPGRAGGRGQVKGACPAPHRQFPANTSA